MSKAWLKDLEEKVHEAVSKLRDLRQANERLEKQVAELQGQLESTVSAEDAAAWQEERTEIRERVETLAGNLEELLGE